MGGGLEAFQYFENSRTNHCILQGQFIYLQDFLAVSVGIFPAGFRPVLIHAAIIFAVEERTWGRLQHVIAVFIHSQIAIDKVSRLHPHCFCDALNIVLIKYRACRLAAVRTLQTINFFKDLVVDPVESVVYPPGILPLKARKKFPVLLFLIFGL